MNQGFSSHEYTTILPVSNPMARELMPKATISDIGSMKLGIDTLLYQVEEKNCPSILDQFQFYGAKIALIFGGTDSAPVLLLFHTGCGRRYVTSQ